MNKIFLGIEKERRGEYTKSMTDRYTGHVNVGNVGMKRFEEAMMVHWSRVGPHVARLLIENGITFQQTCDMTSADLVAKIGGDPGVFIVAMNDGIAILGWENKIEVRGKNAGKH